MQHMQCMTQYTLAWLSENLNNKIFWNKRKLLINCKHFISILRQGGLFYYA